MGYATNAITSLPFENIIGGPMKAAIKAQSLAAHETVSFIKEVGFKPKNSNDFDEDFKIPTIGDDGNSEMGEVRNITFSYETKEADGTLKTAKLKVPVLTVVPIPFLRIDELNIDFVAKISEVIAQKTVNQSVQNYASRFSSGFSSWWSPWKASFSASYSSRHSSTHAASSRYSTEMTMNVDVRAVQDELPAGLSRVLGILEDIINEDDKTGTSSTTSTKTTSTK